MLEGIVMTLLLCSTGQWDCSINKIESGITVQVCDFDLAGKEGFVNKFQDRPDEVTGESFTLIIKQVNCEET